MIADAINSAVAEWWARVVGFWTFSFLDPFWHWALLGAAICAVAFVVAWFFGSLFPWLRAIGGLVVAFIVWGLWVYWTAEKESRAFDKKRRRK